MTEELDDEKRTWYLKGYAQAEADQEVLIKKLMKDISDLSAERIGWINESGFFNHDAVALIKVTQERDEVIDYLKDGLQCWDMVNQQFINHKLVNRYIEHVTDYLEQIAEGTSFIKDDLSDYNRLVIENDELKMRLFDALRMIKNPNISRFDLRLKRIEDYLQENK